MSVIVSGLMIVRMTMAVSAPAALRVALHSHLFYFEKPAGAASSSAFVVGGMKTPFREFVDAVALRCHYQGWQRNSLWTAISQGRCALRRRK